MIRESKKIKISDHTLDATFSAAFQANVEQVNAAFYPADAEIDDLDDEEKAELAFTWEEAIEADVVLAEYDAED